MEKVAKPAKFQMAIQGGMLEALGINMYTTLGKCLVEFAANAYDSDASRVEISIPFDKIEDGRAQLKAEDKAARAALKNAVSIAEGSPDTTVGPGDQTGEENLYATMGTPADGVVHKPASIASVDISLFKKTLPESIAIVITDYGHGMSPKDVAEKFLPVNRHRRADNKGTESNLHSEGNKRAVMGRKGLGKLAGFGIAEKIVIETKREGDDFKTRFELDAAVLSKAQNLSNVDIPATYEADGDLSRCVRRSRCAR